MCLRTLGHPYAQFRRAVATGNARIAEPAARDLQHVGLRDALELVLLYREDRSGTSEQRRGGSAGLVAERTTRLRLSELELAAGAFREALYSDRGVTTLREKVL